MASDTDSASLLTDALTSIDASSSQGKIPRSPIHEYSREPKDHEPKHNSKGRKIIYYSICLYGGSLTTNLKYHLKSKHQIVIGLSSSSTKAMACEKLKQLYDEASA